MAKRKIVQIDEALCTGCGECIPNCAEGAMKIINGKAKLIADKLCDGLGACLGHCPEGAIKIIEREADEFDEAAVHSHLEGRKAAPCPSTILQVHSDTVCACETANVPRAEGGGGASALRQWPVQITLVPPHAPFLKGSDLLIAADCTAFASAALHTAFLPGRSLLVGCPKLDNAQAYVQKFKEIFEVAELKSVTVLIMEVPCCGMLPRIVQEAMKLSGRNIPTEVKVISTKGELK